MKNIKYSHIIVFLLIAINTFAQNEVLSFKNEQVSKRITKDSYSMSNTENNDLAIVLVERTSIFAYLFDSEFKKKSYVEVAHLKNKCNEVIGYSISGQNYYVLYTNDKKNRFTIVNIDFESKTITSSEIELDYKDEIYIDALNYKNKLYFLTASDDLKLTLRTYDNNLNFKVAKTFNLDQIKDKSLLIDTKYRLGVFFLSGNSTSGVTKIDQRIPNSIEQTSSESKLYQSQNRVYLSFDDNENKTSIYDVDLENLTLDYKTFEYPKGKIDELKKFNSYIYEDKLYQIASSKDEMCFVVKTLDNVLVKSFYVDKETPIAFKNSPIVQEGATAVPFVNRRELEETTKYLRKITAGNVGLSVIKNNNMYYVTLGGFNVTYTGPTMVAPTFTSAGTYVNYNPAFLSYQSYVTTKSTYFNSVFDLDFNHIKGEVKEDNVLNKIKSYSSLKKYITAEDVFFHNDEIYYGSFNLKEGSYSLVRF